MKRLKRRYVYEETYNEIMEWAKDNNLKRMYKYTSFPFYLQEYLEELKRGK